MSAAVSAAAIIEAVSVIIVFCSWQDGRNSVWGGIQGLHLGLGQTHSGGKSKADLSGFVTSSPQEAYSGVCPGLTLVGDLVK